MINALKNPQQFFQGLTGLAVQRSKPVEAVVASAMTTPEDSVMPEDLGGVKYTVVYNPASFDSVYAAAQLVSTTGLNVVKCVSHGILEDAENLMGAEHLLVVGTELNKDCLLALYNTGIKLTLFAYRDGYSWLDNRIKARWGERLEMVYPCDDAVNELTLLTDNTAIWTTFTWLYAQELTTQLPLVEMSRITAMRQVGLAWPVMPDLTPVGDAAPHEEEIRYKSILFNMLPAVRSALRSSNPLQKLKAIEVDTKTNAYLEHWRNMGTAYRRGQVERPYKTGSRMLFVPTVACTEMLHYDMVMMASTHGQAIITYEDVAGLRVWRIFAGDRSQRMALLESFGGRETWVDGPCVCTYTQVRELV